MNRNVLITYFSLSGHTEYIAKLIQKEVGGELFPIHMKFVCNFTDKTKPFGIYFDTDKADLTNYDTVFVGTPAWCHTLALPVRIFLKNNKFNNKTIVPFISHGLGNEYKIPEVMKKLTHNAEQLKFFAVREIGSDATIQQNISNWLNEIFVSK